MAKNDNFRRQPQKWRQANKLRQPWKQRKQRKEYDSKELRRPKNEDNLKNEEVPKMKTTATRFSSLVIILGKLEKTLDFDL